MRACVQIHALGARDVPLAPALDQLESLVYLPIAWWTERITLEPSPTAAAIRFIEP